MGTQIRLFFSGIVNSLNPDGYKCIVTPTRKLGDSTKIIAKKTRLVRKNNSFRIQNDRQQFSTATY